tara:strand:- start:76998 stop:77252 length:255 start_codon:yes stop_codon:yes gene_type:complete
MILSSLLGNYWSWDYKTSIMGKKSNKSIMHKQIVIIFISLLSLATITGCGIKGPLYQTPEQQQENLAKTSEETDKSMDKTSLEQ